MTSSNHLKSRLRSGLAFPIMLAAVGLLLASLVLGFGTNLVNALGKDNGGICDYSELMRKAILANNNDKIFECDSAAYTAATGADPGRDLWGGAKTGANDGDAPNDLDLTDAEIDVFKPGKGELDGFVRGSRVDLRGTGLTVADIDISDARKTFATEGTNTDDDDDTIQFGTTVTGLSDDTVGNLGLTFLLDGGSTSANGLAAEAYDGVEGEIVWVTFQYGEPHSNFKHPSDIDISVWARVNVTVEHDNIAAAGADPDTTSVVSAVISTLDGEGTLYAVPFLFPDDSEIEKDKRYDIEVAFAAAGTFAHVTTANDVQATSPFVDGESGVLAITATDFNDSLGRSDEADLTIADEDTPAVPLSDRQDAVSEYISDFFGISDKRVGVDHLAGKVNGGGTGSEYNSGKLLQLPIGNAPVPLSGQNGATPPATVTFSPVPDGPDPDGSDAISSISVADLAGLTGLTKLDLSRNKIAELPSGLFAEVGTDSKADLSTEINLMGDKMGPNGDGFFLDNLGPAGDELVAGQYLVVRAPRKDKRVGFLHGSYVATEGGALVFDINIRGDADDGANRAIQFIKTAGDTGNLPGNEKDKDVENVFVDLRKLSSGNYRIAVGLPVNDDEDGDNTLTAVFGSTGITDLAADLNAAATTTTMTGIVDWVPVTIRDKSYEAPVDVPVAPESSFDSVVVTQNEYVEAPGNEDLKHNISNFTVTVGGNAVSANFLDVYNATGGLERWGYPTSEVVEISGIGLTQFFQFGALHLESNAEVKRLLAWDFVGGGEGGSTDQGVEAAPETAPEGGVQVGAFGHYVADVDADGNATGFLEFFNRLGGVEAFGFPKTEAREDTGAEDMLLEPGDTLGFTRQYFQAAVFQLAEDGSVELTLLGDTLRGILVPDFAEIDEFGAADPLLVGDEVSPPVIDS